MIPEMNYERQARALTGAPTEKLASLEAVFALALDDEKERMYREGIRDGKRERKPGGGQKGKLPTAHEKLVFVLYFI